MHPLASGAFSDVFDLGDGRVLKAFFEIKPEVAPTADPALVPLISFYSELRVYQRLLEHPGLPAYTPQFFGVADPSSYPLATDRIYPCGLLLEKIPGKPKKLFELDQEIEAAASMVIERLQERVLLEDPWDASCFVPGTRAGFTLIDFATPSDRLAALDKILVRHGHVPPDKRRLLGLPDANGVR